MLLHLDKQQGSIKVGKDADLVLWTAEPLSIYAKVQTTWVDGIPYFDAETDAKMRAYITTERARLTAKMLEDEKSSGNGTTPTDEEEHLWHCDDMGDFGNQ